MTPQVKDILCILEDFAPSDLAEKWDNVGLLVGNKNAKAATILIGLDPTNTLLDEALSLGADTLITHHPVIFHPLSAIHTDDPSGKLLQRALSNNINIIACHTNLDSALGGVNDVLAKGLGLADLLPLKADIEGSSQGLGRIGNLKAPVSRKEFLHHLLTFLQMDSISIAGPIPDKIQRVAVCGGSGSDFAALAHSGGADVYISAEIKHSTAIWAQEIGFGVIDGTHYATEKPATAYLAAKLREIIKEKKWQTTIKLTEAESHPFASVHISSLTNR